MLPFSPTTNLPPPMEDSCDFHELQVAIHGLSDEHRELIEPALNKIVASDKQSGRTLDCFCQVHSQLSLDMKHLEFDMEATKRERDHCMERLSL